MCDSSKDSCEEPEMRDGDPPTFITPKGTKIWGRITGKILVYSGDSFEHISGITEHREGGPAIIHADGEQRWYQNGHLHREDGPAVINVDGYQAWYWRGKRHRIGGPVITHYVGRGGQEWWINGIRQTPPAPAEQ
jgi:hypothetical protein